MNAPVGGYENTLTNEGTPVLRWFLNSVLARQTLPFMSNAATLTA